MKSVLHFIIYFTFILNKDAYAAYPWVWTCDGDNATCSRVLPSETNSPQDFMECKMTCSDQGLVWPLPTGTLVLDKTLVNFENENDIFLGNLAMTPSVLSLITQFFDLSFLQYLADMKIAGSNFPNSPSEGPARQANLVSNVQINIVVMEDYEDLTYATDESYSLEVLTSSSNVEIQIDATTFFGARHALETTAQLITWNRMRNLFQIHGTANIQDEPFYKHRGISFDTSRNFNSVATLKRVLDGMSHNKLNIFHWHFSDSQSFTLELPSVPQLAQYGAYFEHMVYSVQDIIDIVQYAKIRGIKIMPELDAPAHAANGWQFGEIEGLGKLALCVNLNEPRCRGGVCGILNPSNPNLYSVLADVYGDLISLFPNTDSIHMGGDEVKFDCWKSSPEVSQWMQDHGLEGSDGDFYRLWGEFQKNASAELTNANRGEKMKQILWTSTLTDREESVMDIPLDDYIIQLWMKTTKQSYADVINRGYDVIVSPEDMWYLDCGHGNWADKQVSSCDPFKQWRDVYDFDPIENYLTFPNADEGRVGQILGGEVTTWSEYHSEFTVEGRLWPRAAAFAERMWSSNVITDWKEAEVRMVHQRERMAERGIRADGIQMLWCHQNELRCRLEGV